MKIRSMWTVLVFVVLLAAAALAVDGQAAGLRQPGSPVIFPAANAQDVSQHTHIRATYDVAIDPLSVSPQSFAVHGSQTGHIQQVLKMEDGNTVIDLAPSRALFMGELVYATATTQIKDAADNQGAAAPTVWVFRVRTEGGTGFFGSNRQNLGDHPGQDIELGDLDRDGDLDAFVANCGASYVWRNDGAGQFIINNQALGASDCSVNASLGDLDMDGDLDIVNVHMTGIRVWLNTGSGYYSDSGQNLGVSSGTAAELGDLDGDGDLDIFYTIRNAPNQVLLNDGNGQFTLHSSTADTDISTGAALADLDADGDLDAWVTVSNGSSSAHRVYKNNGQAVFSVWQTIPAYPANSVSLGDLDGNGTLDAFLAVIKLGATGPNQVWWNDGNGTFTDSGQRMGENSTNQIALGDLDGDGDLDGVAINMNKPNEVWFNDGSGIFSHGAQIFAFADTPHAALGDLNDDGSLDLFLIRFDEPDRVMLNEWEHYVCYMPWIDRK